MMKQFERYKVYGRYGDDNKRVHLTVEIIEDNNFWTNVKVEPWGIHTNGFKYPFFKSKSKRLKWKRII